MNNFLLIMQSKKVTSAKILDLLICRRDETLTPRQISKMINTSQNSLYPYIKMMLSRNLVVELPAEQGFKYRLNFASPVVKKLIELYDILNAQEQWNDDF